MASTSAAEVHVWSLETTDIPEWATHAHSRILTPWEHERADAYVSELDRRDYVWAHVLRRLLLARCFDVPANLWRFESARLGKPVIVNRVPDGRAECGITHTRGFVGAVAALDSAVGIDVECRHRPLETDIAPLICSASEAAALRAVGQCEQREALLRLWVRKESFAKAVGLGLSMPLPHVDLGSEGCVRLLEPVPGIDRAEDWQVRDMPTDHRWLMAIAVHADDRSIAAHHTHMTWETLVHLA
nr:4'-phosphopantetheinyl transferase superfamily protein [Burkholderia guangdongensis]